MKTDDFLFLTSSSGHRQSPWPVAAVYDRNLTLAGLVSALEAQGTEVLHLADAPCFSGFAQDHAIDVAIIQCDGRDVSALRMCDEIKASARGFFLPIILLRPDADPVMLQFARSASADLVLPASSGLETIAARTADLLTTPRISGPWTIYGWMAVNGRDKKAASSGLPIPMKPVPFELYRMMLEEPLAAFSLEGFAARMLEVGIGHSRPEHISNVLTSIRRSFEIKGELFPLRTLYRQGYRLELGIRRNAERYSRKPRSRLFVGATGAPAATVYPPIRSR
jgi:DNA-binding response OmpR family regulator